MEFGKSTFSISLAQFFERKELKTLIIDFDIWNSSINTILGINKYPKEIKNIESKNLITKLSDKLHVFCGIDLIINLEYENNYIKIKEILDTLKNDYEFIIVDTSSEVYYKYIKTILSMSNKIIFLVEPNLSEIKKAKKLLEIYINDWNINAEKIKILFNKTNKYQISEDILKEIFSKFELIGNLKYDEKINLLINKNGKIKFNEENNLIFEKIYNNKEKNDERRIGNIKTCKILLNDVYDKRFIFRRKKNRK